jgi:hypothetical protein
LADGIGASLAEGGVVSVVSLNGRPLFLATAPASGAHFARQSGCGARLATGRLAPPSGTFAHQPVGSRTPPPRRSAVPRCSAEPGQEHAPSTPGFSGYPRRALRYPHPPLRGP